MALVPSCLLQFVFGLWQKKKDWGHVPMEQNKKYITSGLAFEFTFRKQRGPNAIKGAYFESIFSFLWFDQKAKYLVPIFQLSN